MYICDRCQKSYLVGMNVSHSHRRTKTKNIPNLHTITVKVDGRNQTMRLCTKCTRIIRKQYPRIAAETKVEKKAEIEVKSEPQKEEILADN